MKRLTITLDPGTDTWNTDRWHRRWQEQGDREHLKVTFDSITTIFHNLLHDIPCEIPAGMQGLEEILSGEEESRREKIKKQIGNSNRMVAFVQFLVAGPWIEVTFYEGNKKRCNFLIQYEKEDSKILLHVLTQNGR